MVGGGGGEREEGDLERIQSTKRGPREEHLPGEVHFGTKEFLTSLTGSSSTSLDRS